MCASLVSPGPTCDNIKCRESEETSSGPLPENRRIHSRSKTRFELECFVLLNNDTLLSPKGKVCSAFDPNQAQC